MNIVLHEPEIPQNAGNIARTCSVTNTVLHLIKPLGFSVEDKYLKRAGLDYWKELDIRYYENFGIPEEILLDYRDTAVRIPMYGEARSLNLSNSVAIILYEALRQQSFDGLKLHGQLHRHEW